MQIVCIPQCGLVPLIAELKTEPLVLPEKARAKVEAKTLVLYVYAGSDPEAKQNLLYFIREGIQVTQSNVSAYPHQGCT